MAEHLNRENFKSTIEKLDVAVVDFWAEWCGPCNLLSPILEEFEQKTEGRLKLFKVNVDKDPIIASEYGVESIPTLLTFKGGIPTNSFTGLASKQAIEEYISSAIK
ncbi:MAG: thioredoxin [Candidatus Parvarchaeota archaeon]|nr:thioredoxin [Candidatus Parvarchaeota archaeon]MCL5101700.1 thioredoxin [Candidatus Parvarchaeota archaeon]